MTPNDYSIDAVRTARGAVLLPPPLSDLGADETWKAVAFLRGHPDAPRPPGVVPLPHEDDDAGLATASPPDARGAAAVAFLGSDNVIVLARGGAATRPPLFVDVIALAGTNGADARIAVALHAFYPADADQLAGWAPVDGGLTLVAGRRERIDLRRALRGMQPGALALVPMRVDDRAPLVVYEIAAGCAV